MTPCSTYHKREEMSTQGQAPVAPPSAPHPWPLLPHPEPTHPTEVPLLASLESFAIAFE